MNTGPIKLDDSTQRMRRTELVGSLGSHSISDRRVLDVMAAIPRHLFVPPALSEHAYENRALAIGFGQTISQPLMVALMLEAMHLEGTEHVLDVGTGSGYQAALLSRLARDVISVDVIPELVERSRSRLEQLGFDNVEVLVGDGSLGYPSGAPYDAIAVAAAAPKVPQALVDQLGEGGFLVIPIGDGGMQELVSIYKQAGQTTTHKIAECTFVPLVGEAGFSGADA